MTNNRYYITKKNNSIGGNATIDYSKMGGLDISPKNRISYDGIIVNKLVIIKSSFIERILKKKIKRKLELYLKFIMDFIDSDEDDGDSLREALNDITRYKDIINYKYRKYLGDKYIDQLLNKIEFLEHELKLKLYIINEKQSTLGENSIGSKSR